MKTGQGLLAATYFRAAVRIFISFIMFYKIILRLKQKPLQIDIEKGYETVLETYFKTAYYTCSAVYKIDKDKAGKYVIRQNSLQKVSYQIKYWF